MRASYGFSLVAVFALFLLAFPANGQSETPKIGVMDMARLMRDSIPGKEGIKFIETQQAQMQKRLDEIQDRLEKNPGDEEAMREMQKVYSSAQQKVQAEGQNVVNTLMETIQRVANDFRERGGYDLLIGSDAAYSFSPRVDVTNALLEEINKQKVEFKPLPQPAAEKPLADTAGAPGSAKKATEDGKKEKTAVPAGKEAAPKK